MDVVATPGGRKRGFDEQSFDETATPTPGPLKRRKLDDGSSPSAPRAIGAAIASAISGVFGFSSQPNLKAGPHEPLKETSPNVNANVKPHLDDEQRPSSLNGGGLISQLKQPAAALTPPRSRPAIKLSALRGTKWDTGDLDLGPSPSPKKPAKPRGRTPKKDAVTKRNTATRPKAQTEPEKKESEKDAEVGTEIEGETKTRRGRGAKNATESTRGAGRGRGAGRARGTGRGAGRGRGRRPAAERVAVAADVVEPSDAEPEDEPGNSPSQSKSLKRMSSAIATADHLDDTADELSSTEVPDITPLKHRSFDLNSRLAASTGKSSPLPKSILSPTKKAGSQLKKSVSFNGAGGEVFFEDLPKSVSVNKTPKDIPTPVEPILESVPTAGNEFENENEDEEESEDDEITCAICSRPESEPPNEIILCDNCDFAAHQVCYEVPEIPEGDWLCKSCIQEDILNGTPRKPIGSLSKTDTASAAEEIPDIPNLDHHLRALQRILLDRCAGRRRIRMFGQDEAYEKTQQLVEQTVNAGEGNSMLLIGPRGCGKTTMLENIVGDLSRQHGRDFYVVRLNGFIHTDDKLALKEIWRQLGKEMNVEDDLLNRSNYADTMASLLALLSHPSEILGVDEGVTSQSVVFIIDEFDMFAAHPRQTLLYNLFDIAQSRKAPIAVLGCTTRLDVVEMLEKRVKSRFSHRYVYLSLPRSLPAYWQICRQGLMVGEEDGDEAGLDVRVEGHVEFHKYWNQKITGLYNQQAFQDLLQYHFYTTKAPSAFFNEWILPLSSLSATHLELSVPTTLTAGFDSTSLTPPDSRTQLLSTLSDLELGLVIAGARLDIIADTDTVNFAMVYDEYSTLVGRQRAQSATSGLLAVGGSARVWSRGVAGIAWERLITLGLLVPAGVGGVGGAGSSSRSLGHGGLDGKMWRVDVALEEIPASTKLSSVLGKWCKEI